MKKILALVLALTLVFALSACGGKTDEPTSELTTAADIANDVSEEATEAATDATEAASAEATEAATDATEAASTEATEAASTEATEAATDAATTNAADTKGLNSTDAAAVVAFYNKAVKASEKSAPKGQSTMKLDGGITGDGGLGAVLKIASPIIESTLERNSTSTDYIPGHDPDDLLASDVKSASAVSKNGVTTITIQLKDQTDGPTADANKAGPVARGISTLGNVDNAINELGAELYSGKDTIKLLYNNAYIKCTVDENTGKITGGTWHYKVNVTVGNAEIKLGLKFNAKNLKAVIDYTVAL